MLDINALKGKRIGYIPSTWVDPFGTTGTITAEKAALRYLTDAGALIVEMGTTVGGTDAPPQTPDTTTGNVRSEGWMQYVDRHPELAAQGFKIISAVDVDCSQKEVAYVRADAASCSVMPAPRMTPLEIKAKRDYRLSRQSVVKTWMDTAGSDHLGVDAIVYPGLLSEISVNDGGGARPSFGRRDTPPAQPTAFQQSSCLPALTTTGSRSAFNFSDAHGTTPNLSAWPMLSSMARKPPGTVMSLRPQCPH